jgi:hypothetical protein
MAELQSQIEALLHREKILLNLILRQEETILQLTTDLRTQEATVAWFVQNEMEIENNVNKKNS